MTGEEVPAARSVLVTGASGLIGSQVVALLASEPGSVTNVVAVDVREVSDERRIANVRYEVGDIRDPGLGELMTTHEVDTVVHLAAIVTPGRDSSREFEYSVDVTGTKNMLECSRRAGVLQFIYTSSGAAYGYHADNPALLDEDDALRGNPEFAYADHKRLVEEMLAQYRENHPGLAQLVFRPGTILGEHVASPITAMFERPVVVGVAGTEILFVLIWDTDVARCIVRGIHGRRTGIFNVAGDGTITLREIARRLDKRYLAVPEPVLKGVLAALKALRLSSAGPEQVKFLCYRPVLSNERLKTEFGFTPSSSSEECFERYRRIRFPAAGRGSADGVAPADAGSLAGRTVVITGAAGGIGAALARRFAREGARVALLDRDVTGAEAVAAELNAQLGGEVALARACDVTSLDDCRAAISDVIDVWGGIDILVNNAGITHLGAFADTDVDVIRRVMDVNLFGSVNCTKAALPSLLERRGQIVVTSSVAGVAPLATRTGYSASKHALHGFFDSLRAEHHDAGLRVMIVCPSFVDTAIGDHALGTDGNKAGPEARTGVKAPVPPGEIADAIVVAALANRRLLLVPREARLAYWVARLAPRLYERLMLRRTATS